MKQEATYKQLTKNIGKHVFKYNAHVLDKNTDVWTSEHQIQFTDWLNTLYQKNRDAFKIQQIRLPVCFSDIINKIKKEHPGTDDSDVIKACIRVYFDAIKDQKNHDTVESIFYDKELQQLIKQSSNTSYSVIFKPLAFMDIEGMASAFSIKKQIVITDAVTRVLACYFFVKKHTDEKFAFWIQEQLFSYLKAA